MSKFFFLAVGVAFAFTSVSANAQGKWTVVRKKDEMTGVAKVRACIGSTNSIKQGFPYGQETQLLASAYTKTRTESSRL